MNWATRARSARLVDVTAGSTREIPGSFASASFRARGDQFARRAADRDPAPVAARRALSRERARFCRRACSRRRALRPIRDRRGQYGYLPAFVALAADIGLGRARDDGGPGALAARGRSRGPHRRGPRGGARANMRFDDRSHYSSPATTSRRPEGVERGDAAGADWKSTRPALVRENRARAPRRVAST